MKINILQGAFLPVPPKRGGAIESAWHLLGLEFAKLGHNVTHFSRLCDDLPKNEFVDGVQYHRIPGSNAVKNPFLLKILEFPYVLRARRLMPKADIMVTHAFWAPIIFPPKRFGNIYVHVGRYPKGQLRLYGRASCLQVPTNAIANACRRQASDQVQKVSVIPYPLPWNVDENLDLKNRKKMILYAGRLHPEKGLLQLINGWGGIPHELTREWTLRLIGPWREEEGGGGLSFLKQIKQEISKCRNRVEIVDPVFDRKALKKEMRTARIFVYPSLAEKGETFGLAVLEAMSCGCVPIVSNLPCFSDFIDFNKQSYCLGDASQVNDIQQSIGLTLKRAITANPAKLDQMATSAWLDSKEYELSKIAKKYTKDFSSLL